MASRAPVPVRPGKALAQAARAHEQCAAVATAAQRTELETDQHRLDQRTKQVEKGKLTPEYQRFRALVPEGHANRRVHPSVPDPSVKMSARLWNLRVKTWRRCLHDYDADQLEPPPPFISARWLHTVQKSAGGIPKDMLRPCGEALERRARELSPQAAAAALGAPPAAEPEAAGALGGGAAVVWTKTRVQGVFQLLDQLDGAKGKGVAAAAPEPEPQTSLYALPKALSISVASTAQEVNAAMQLLTADTHAVLGLDTEWAPADAAAERVTLLQLSSETHCVLVRLAALDAVPESLRLVLADECIIKCGVSIHHDAELLLAQYSLRTNGCVDLAGLGHVCGRQPAVASGEHSRSYRYTRDGLGLNAVIQSVLGCHLSKEVSVRCSDWGADLTSTQVYYAACDAHAAQRALLQLYQSHSSGAGDALVLEWCQGLIVFDRAIARPERDAMRSEVEQAVALELQQPAAVVIDASPPMSAVKSPDGSGDGMQQQRQLKHIPAKPKDTTVHPVSFVTPADAQPKPKGAWGAAAAVQRKLFESPVK